MSNHSKPRLMIVDDAPEDIHLLLHVFQDSYQVSVATSADDALETLSNSEQLPDLILMDVNMPGTNGHDACKKMKADSQLKEIDIIFLSANDSTEEILSGLDAGAVDYVVKPFEPTILESKVKNALNASTKRHQLKQQADSASQLIYTVMAESGSLGNIVNFYRSSFLSSTPEQLAKLVIESIAAQQLNAVILLSLDQIKEVESTSGIPNMLEVELLERLIGHKEPFVEKGERCFAIHKHSVVLIKNMPTDEIKRGSLKDFVKIILEGADSKLLYFAQLLASSSKKTKNIAEAILKVKTTLDEVKQKQAQHKKQSMNILDEMVSNVEASFFPLGLTDEQEEQLLSILTGSVTESLEHVEKGLKMDESIQLIVEKLEQVAKEAAS